MTAVLTAEVERGDLVAGSEPDEVRHRVGRVNLWLCLVTAALTIASTTSGHAVTALVLLVVTVAIALGGRRSALGNVPLAFLSVLFTTIVTWSAAGWWRPGLLSPVVAARGLVVGMAALAVLLAVARRRDVTAARLASRTELIAGLPAAALAGYGMVTAGMPVAVGSRWFLVGADSTSHLLIASAVRSTGALDYRTDAYPRGWHTVVATMIGASGEPMGSPEGLVAAVRVSALATWGAYVLLVLVTGLYAARLARALHLPERTAAFAGAGAGATMLSASFFTFTMAMGFQTTIVLAFLLVLGADEVGAPASAWRAYLATSMALVAVAHTWQMALPVAVLPWASSLWALRRTAGRAAHHVVPILGLVATVALAFPPLWAAATQLGLRQAASWGVTGRLPIEWLVVGAASIGVCLRSGRRSLPVLLLTAMTATTVATGALVAAAVHTSLTAYYPTKMFWHAATFAVPPTCVVLGRIASRAGGPGARPVVRLQRASVVGVAAIVGLVAFLTPLVAVTGGWSRDEAHTLQAVTRPEARHAQLTWRATPGPVGDVLALMLLDYYTVGTGSPRTQPVIMTHEQECARLRSSAHPAVLTSASQREVSDRYSCVSNVRAIATGVGGGR